MDLVLWIMKAVEYFKLCLMGHTSRSREDISAKNYLNCWRFTQEVSEEKNLVCYLEIALVLFWRRSGCLLPCLNLPEAKMKSF